MILVNVFAFHKTHGQHEKSHMVATLRRSLKVGYISPAGEVREVKARQLILCIGVPGKSRMAKELRALCRFPGTESGGGSVIFLLSIHHHQSGTAV